MNKDLKIKKINFTSLTKRYWKEQLLFYIICTLSCIGSFLISENGTKAFIRKINNKSSDNVLFFFGKKVKNFGNNKKSYFVSISFLILIYSFIVFFHVLFSFYLRNKIMIYLKRIVANKLFRLRDCDDKKRISSLLTYNVRVFSESIFHIPNQIYYVVVSIILNMFSLVKVSQIGLSILAFIYFNLLLITCIVLQRLFYTKEILFQDSLENEMKNELFLIENRDLIIKKGLIFSFLSSYNSLLLKTFYNSNKRDIVQSLSFVFPSFCLIKIFFPLSYFFVNEFDSNVAYSIQNLVDFFNNFKKIIERSNEYPFCISSQEKINNFLKEPERNDRNKGLLIFEKIEDIFFNHVTFSYGERKILDKLSINFQIGNINHVNFPNGFGKSTIISLLMGIIELDQGEVIINKKYCLNKLNLEKWREKISYSEHRNLLQEKNLSTGQKQLIDLERSFEDKSKEIYIFDEADSNLDPNNREIFLSKIKKISKTKIVILISHFFSD